MELKILSKKPVKFVTLLLTAMLIASASAAVYYSLSMTSTISVATASVYFVEGADQASAGVNLSADNKTAQLTTLKAYPNVTTTYADPIRVRNNHTSSSFNVRLVHLSLSGAATNFVFVNFTMTWTNGTEIQAFDYTSDQASWTPPSSPSAWHSIPNSTEWIIKVETKAVAGATSDTVTIEMTIDVE